MIQEIHLLYINSALGPRDCGAYNKILGLMQFGLLFQIDVARSPHLLEEYTCLGTCSWGLASPLSLVNFQSLSGIPDGDMSVACSYGLLECVQ